jgi:hypothetical protein
MHSRGRPQRLGGGRVAIFIPLFHRVMASDDVPVDESAAAWRQLSRFLSQWRLLCDTAPS